MQIKGRIGMVVGRQHTNIMLRPGGSQTASPLIVESLHNRQDMIGIKFVYQEDAVEVSQVICDGCSSSAFSEVGAGLFAQLGATKLAQLVQYYGIESPLVSARLYQWFLETMRSTISLHPHGLYYLSALDLSRSEGIQMLVDEEEELREVYDWIQNNLLFTIVASYVGKEGTLTLRRGDGGFYVDGHLDVIDYDNVPPYMGYSFFSLDKIQAGILALTAEGKKVKTPPPGFETTYYPNANRIAMFSDGMPVTRINEVWDTPIPINDWPRIQRNKLQKLIQGWWLEHNTTGYLLRDDLILSVFDRQQPGLPKSVPISIPFLDE